MNVPRIHIERRIAGLAFVALLLLAGGCAKRVTELPHLPATGENPPRIEHRVAAGETLAQIADNYYGDPGQAGRIARANGLENPGQLLAGSLLQLEFAPDEWDSARRRASALEPYNRGVDLMAQERLAEAERQFRLALDTAPELQAAGYNLALVQMKRGKYDEAVAQLDGLIAQRPDDLDFRFARGNALFQLTRFDEATAEFETILAQDPQHRRAQFSLARSLQEAGRLGAARAAWERYLELDADSSWAAQARRHLQDL